MQIIRKQQGRCRSMTNKSVEFLPLNGHSNLIPNSKVGSGVCKYVIEMLQARTGHVGMFRLTYTFFTGLTWLLSALHLSFSLTLSHACIHARTHTHTQTHTYTDTSPLFQSLTQFTHTHTHTHTHTLTHIRSQTHTHSQTNTHT